MSYNFDIETRISPFKTLINSPYFTVYSGVGGVFNSVKRLLIIKETEITFSLFEKGKSVTVKGVSLGIAAYGGGELFIKGDISEVIRNA